MMSSGRVVIVLMLAVAALGGAAMYYAEVYAYYEAVPADSAVAAIRLVPADGGSPQRIRIADFRGIDATSSPIRFRACFTVRAGPAALRARYRTYPEAVPLTGPGWFDCYDADAIGAALESGRATAYLSQPEIATDVVRVVAVFADRRAYAWQQLTEEAD